jgi:hypothetical protein
VLNDGYVVDEMSCRDIHAVQARIQLHPPPGSQPVNRGLVQSLPTRSHYRLAVADADFRRLYGMAGCRGRLNYYADKLVVWRIYRFRVDEPEGTSASPRI